LLTIHAKEGSGRVATLGRSRPTRWARGVLLRRGMDATFFSLKRAYHGTLRIAWKRVRALGLTSARFDLLFALTRQGVERGPSTFQSTLRRVLGTSRATASRMLISLEELGLVRRHRSHIDRRQLVVELTDEGWVRIHTAYRELTMSDWAFLALDYALGEKVAPEKEWPAIDDWVYDAIEELQELLIKLRRGFGDVATLRYCWFPIDFDA
jgi:DNA-binding MarR family transcriptional regulator